MSNSEVKPKECEVTFQIIGNPLFSEKILMIEKSAYQSLQKENEDLKTRIEELKKYISMIQAHIEVFNSFKCPSRIAYVDDLINEALKEGSGDE